jgi:membrane carboxypeptidase/penicillin-binding protein
MGKTGTTNEFRDAIFVGSTYGPDGITAAVRIGFDDNRSLGSRETGGRLALPVFQELMLGVYRDKIVGPAPPAFPARMEQRITSSLLPPNPPAVTDLVGDAVASVFTLRPRRTSPAETHWLLQNGMKGADADRSTFPAARALATTARSTSAADRRPKIPMR